MGVENINKFVIDFEYLQDDIAVKDYNHERERLTVSMSAPDPAKPSKIAKYRGGWVRDRAE